MILWRDSVKFSEDFSDGAILEVILLESRSILSHLGRRELVIIGCRLLILGRITETDYIKSNTGLYIIGI
jgi:hypothetical protein